MMRSREEHLELKLKAIMSVLNRQMDELDALSKQQPLEIEEVLLRQKLMREIVNAIKSVGVYNSGDYVDCTNDCDYADVTNGECECFNRQQDEIEARCPI